MDSNVYIFFDERYEEKPAFTSLIVSAILVPQAQYDACAPLARFQSRKSRLADINAFLAKIEGHAHLGIARVSREDFDAKEIDRYSDIAMTRRNHLWSLIVSFTLCDIIAKTTATGDYFQTIEIYYDPKTLRLENAVAWGDAVTQRMLRRGNELLEQRGLNPQMQMCITKLSQSGKVAKRESADKFQRGIWMADQLARHRSSLTISHSSAVSSQDFSTYVEEILREFKQ